MFLDKNTITEILSTFMIILVQMVIRLPKKK